MTDEKVRRSFGDDFFESFERTQPILAERIAYHDRKRAERQHSGDN